MFYTVKITPIAEEDIQNIVDYIARENETASIKFRKTLYSKIYGVLSISPLGFVQ